MVEQIDLHKQVGGKLIKNIRPVYANKSSFVDLRPVDVGRITIRRISWGRSKGTPRGLVSAKNAELDLRSSVAATRRAHVGIDTTDHARCVLGSGCIVILPWAQIIVTLICAVNSSPNAVLRFVSVWNIL